MNIEEIRDRAGHLLGTVETGPDGAQTLKNAVGEVKGYYDPDGDHTRDADRNIVAKGNRLRSLIC